MSVWALGGAEGGRTFPPSVDGALITEGILDDEDVHVLAPLIHTGATIIWFSISACGETDAVTLWNEIQGTIGSGGDITTCRLYAAMAAMITEFERGAILVTEGGFDNVYQLDRPGSLAGVLRAEMTQPWDQAAGFVVQWAWRA